MPELMSQMFIVLNFFSCMWLTIYLGRDIVEDMFK